MPGLEKLWFNRAKVMRLDADDCETTGLREAGWTCTSRTIGSRWMWQKNIDGKIYSVSQAEAARIQEHVDREAYFQQYPDELSD